MSDKNLIPSKNLESMPDPLDIQKIGIQSIKTQGGQEQVQSQQVRHQRMKSASHIGAPQRLVIRPNLMPDKNSLKHSPMSGVF